MALHAEVLEMGPGAEVTAAEGKSSRVPGNKHVGQPGSAGTVWMQQNLITNVLRFPLSTQWTGWTMTKTEAALAQVIIEEGAQVEYAVNAYLNANAVTVMGTLVPPKGQIVNTLHGLTGVDLAYLSMSTSTLTLGPRRGQT